MYITVRKDLAPEQMTKCTCIPRCYFKQVQDIHVTHDDFKVAKAARLAAAAHR